VLFHGETLCQTHGLKMFNACDAISTEQRKVFVPLYFTMRLLLNKAKQFQAEERCSRYIFRSASACRSCKTFKPQNTL